MKSTLNTSMDTGIRKSCSCISRQRRWFRPIWSSTSRRRSNTRIPANRQHRAFGQKSSVPWSQQIRHPRHGTSVLYGISLLTTAKALVIPLRAWTPGTLIGLFLVTGVSSRPEGKQSFKMFLNGFWTGRNCNVCICIRKPPEMYICISI